MNIFSVFSRGCKMRGAKSDYYCVGKPLKEYNAGSWTECSEMCLNEEKCTKWHHSHKTLTCLMYSECDFTKSYERIISKYWDVAGEKSCPGSGG